MEVPGYADEYSEDGFWAKVGKYALSAGCKLILLALWLFYALQRPETPTWAKSVIITALGYFIFPLDVIPDFVPAAGYTDDLGALGAAVATVGFCIDDEVRAQARRKLLEWFPNGCASEPGDPQEDAA